MKETGFLILAFITSSLNAQVDIKLWDYLSQDVVGNNLNGTEQIVAATFDGDYSITLNFKNTSATSKVWKIERFRITDVPAWEDRLNWGVANDPMQEQGYTPGQMSLNPWTVASGYSVSPGGSLNLKAIATTQGAGMELYRYYLVENNGTRIDSVDYRVTTSLGMGSNEKEMATAVFPNPVSEILTIQTSDKLAVSYEFKVMDMHGNSVIESTHEMKQVDVRDFENGVYFIVFYKDNKQVQKTPFVVLHN